MRLEEALVVKDKEYNGGMKIPVRIGKYADGSTCEFDLADETYISIFGGAGTGKDYLVSDMLLDIFGKSTVDVEVLYVTKNDFSLNNIGYDFSPYLKEEYNGLTGLLNLLNVVKEEYDKRSEVCRKYGAMNVNELHTLDGVDKTFPTLVVVVNELTALLLEAEFEDKEKYKYCIETLNYLFAVCRAANIKFVTVEQKPEPRTGTMLAQSSVKIALRLHAKGMYKRIFGSEFDVKKRLDIHEAYVSIWRKDVEKINLRKVTKG